MSWYLDIVSAGWEGLVVGDYETVMPITHARKFCINYLYQPCFTQQLGIFSVYEPNRELNEKILSNIPVKFRYIDLALNRKNIVRLDGFRLNKNVNYELKINTSYNQISQGYATNTRRNIKKAESCSLSVINKVNSEDLITLFRENKGKGLKNIKSSHYLILKQIMNKSLEGRQAEIYGVNSEKGELIAGAFFLQSFNNFIFLFSATNQESKKKGAMFLIIDQFLKKHANNMNTLDFEGSNNKNLARFYRGFGSEEFQYLRIGKNNLPGILRIIKS